MTTLRTLRPDQARRIALAAQGFGRARPAGRVDVRHLRRVLDTTGVVQLDSVNVSARAHYLPSFSRLGPYPTDRLDALLWRSPEAFEYLGHEASVMPMRLEPLLRPRMQRAHWRRVDELRERHPGYIERVHEEVCEHGPLRASDLEDAGGRGSSWWGWSRGKIALEWLYVSGALAIHHRDAQFTVHYDVRERVIPEAVRRLPTPTPDEARAALLLLAARAHGIGTATDLADYFRQPIRPARAALEGLADAGRLERVRVAGWREVAYRHPEARLPRRIRASALLSPFDPVVWFRPRVERLFGFSYRIEIYVPKERRVHGYYVLPFLLDDGLAARVDLRSDRRAGRLEVLGAFAEDGVDRARVATELAAELHRFAAWQGLGEVAVADHGDLAGRLRASV